MFQLGAGAEICPEPEPEKSKMTGSGNPDLIYSINSLFYCTLTFLMFLLLKGENILLSQDPDLTEENIPSGSDPGKYSIRIGKNLFDPETPRFCCCTVSLETIIDKKYKILRRIIFLYMVFFLYRPR